MNPTTNSTRTLAAPEVRVGHAERDSCVSALQHAFEVGQLDEVELEDRLGSALRATTASELAALVADLGGQRSVRSRTAPGRSRPVALALDAVVLLLVGWAAAGSYAGRVGSSVDEGTCIATGLSGVGDCPAPTAEQEGIIAAVQVATDASTQAQEAAVGSADDAPVRAWADKAAAAAERAGRAETDAQVIVATAPDGELAPGALDDPAKAARAASREAVRAALEAEAAAGS